MNIFIYGDSNTWGYVPNINGYSKDAVARQYPQETIWWNRLTLKHNLTVNGVCGRAINNENPWLKGRNATTTILSDLQGENPDLIIVFLGTNDQKSRYNLSAQEIAQQMSMFINIIESVSDAKIMLISPAQIKEGNKITDKFYAGAQEKGQPLDKYYEQLAQENDYLFVSGVDLEAGEDGEHLTPVSHYTLGKRVEREIESFLQNEYQS